MRCKVGDVVLVIRGCAAGYIGVIASESTVEDRDWLVEFPRPALGIDLSGNPAAGRHINYWDSELRPIRPDADPVETEREREVVA